MKLSRQFTVFGSAIFCVVIFSLYLMLDRGHLDYPRGPRQEGSFPQGQLSILQEKIDHLERLLAENNEIISNIRDSVINLSESVEDGPKGAPGNASHGSAHLSSHLALQADPKDCLFASRSGSQHPDVQMLDVYDLIPFDNPDGGVWKQGFDIKYEADEWDSEPLQVFVVPHSHNDPGWLKTFNDYFRDKTQYIFNNMVLKLKEDSRRKFMWSEISYLAKWWDMIDIPKKEAVKSLLQGGQLEIVTGGWVMPDEATPHYFALIDQLIEGHQWLEKNLGVKPRSGWSIDPFGHSPTMAYLLKRAGFSHMLIQRVHYAVKKHFSLQKTLEFFWRQNWDLGSVTDIMCHMMPFYSYDIPHTCGPDPKICCQFDFKRLPGGRYGCPWGVPPEAISPGNVQSRAQMLLDQYRKKSKLFRTKVVLAPLGDDFRFNEYTEWDLQYRNYEQLFNYMNSQPHLKVKIQFGTLSDYFDALEKAAAKKSGQSLFPILSGDFFTYADRDDHYWSGYFTSRPFYKRMDRIMESRLRTAEILYHLALKQAQKYQINKFLSSPHYTTLTEARRNLGLFQHHDAITGTSKDWVVVDYGTRLLQSLNSLDKIIGDSAFLLILKDKKMYQSHPSDTFLKMDMRQSSQDSLPRKNTIQLSAREPRYLVVYNPFEQERDSVVSVCVNSASVKVLTDSGNPVEAQVSAVWNDEKSISQTAYEVSFLAHIPPLGLKVYKLLESQSSSSHLADYFLYNNDGVVENGIFHVKKMVYAKEAIAVENSFLALWFDRSGLLEKVKMKEDNKYHEIKVQFLWYGTTNKRDRSGAYLFLPDGQGQPYVSLRQPSVRVTRGRIYSEITSFFDHVTHKVRLYNTQGIEGQSMEVSNIVDIRSVHNYEIVMRISSKINSQNRFYTDLNGYQIQPRRMMSKLPLQANVYPMSTMAYIQDTEHRLSLLAAQSLGVSSMASGQIEVFMDRRLMQDDNRGLGQGVHDNKVTANLFRILLEKRNGVNLEEEKKSSVNYPSLLSHMTSSFLNHPFLPMILKAEPSSPTFKMLSEFPLLQSSLPCDIHLVNLRTIQSKVAKGYSDEAALILHRKGFDCQFSSPGLGLSCSTTQGKMSVPKVFNQFAVESLIPSSLSLMHTPPEARNMTEIKLSPMEISTFRIRLR
ncbi:alpha-mannosidase 2 isoform X1 [Meriones unguiculatus]|uniref:alpha-mannosidase 2 isoform X1 n=1 Tax=Meriones unguiculatus TaxID=10047 RepID=UPI000B4EAF6B|nr:alpha-mannosidase 2 isoform X1 [Meriones unguiculatus]